MDVRNLEEMNGVSFGNVNVSMGKQAVEEAHHNMIVWRNYFQRNNSIQVSC